MVSPVRSLYIRGVYAVLSQEDYEYIISSVYVYKHAHTHSGQLTEIVWRLAFLWAEEKSEHFLLNSIEGSWGRGGHNSVPESSSSHLSTKLEIKVFIQVFSGTFEMFLPVSSEALDVYVLHLQLDKVEKKHREECGVE
ncbi:hypothetical protein Baya_16020 [Bagarius yarrelli]|uniref:Uncharacterized protein n=1 Tax=Bagarius yarrelli TaxID=175774 RepID=A0A556VU41_BAGYA|nr:hypothetical protein Baya_16020 [Bagarius yarrelli]